MFYACPGSINQIQSIINKPFLFSPISQITRVFIVISAYDTLCPYTLALYKKTNKGTPQLTEKEDRNLLLTYRGAWSFDVPRLHLVELLKQTVNLWKETERLTHSAHTSLIKLLASTSNEAGSRQVRETSGIETLQKRKDVNRWKV